MISRIQERNDSVGLSELSLAVIDTKEHLNLDVCKQIILKNESKEIYDITTFSRSVRYKLYRIFTSSWHVVIHREWKKNLHKLSKQVLFRNENFWIESKFRFLVQSYNKFSLHTMVLSNQGTWFNYLKSRCYQTRLHHLKNCKDFSWTR